MYLWIKSFHVIAMVAWMAGLLYLPRLFVYHTDIQAGTDQDATFKVMEHRLSTYIMLPALLVTWSTGLWLALQIGFKGNGWLHAKLGLVMLLTIAHALMVWHVSCFSKGRRSHSARYFRFFNEIPTLILIAIVILVIVKPF